MSAFYPTQRAQQAIGKMSRLQIMMFKRFDSLNNIKTEYVNRWHKEQSKTPEDEMEMSQMMCIADMMMESTLDTVGVKR
jgi:hypothetical protein